jgi:hypothetical protein
MIKAKLFGDWSKAAAILGDVQRVKKAINWAVVQEAQQARRDIVKGITSQAPGGRPFAALSAITLALRKAKGFGGQKALIRTAGLRNSITVKQAGPGKAFVGVLRGAQSKDGRAMVNVARVHEEGATIVIRVTPKMRKWLMMQLRRAGFGVKKTGRDKKGKFTKGKFKSSGTGQISKGVMVIRIVARPFIRPVIEKINSQPDALRRRLAGRISKKLGMTLGDGT